MDKVCLMMRLLYYGIFGVEYESEIIFGSLIVYFVGHKKRVYSYLHMQLTNLPATLNWNLFNNAFLPRLGS